MIHLDAVGYDGKILAQIDLPELRPTIVLYEHDRLGDAQREAVLSRLRDHGYRMLDLDPDMLAVREDAPLLVRLALRRHRH